MKHLCGLPVDSYCVKEGAVKWHFRSEMEVSSGIIESVPE